jgi:DNA-directed RNA polymerase subunit RPC12/RpoP
MKEPPRAIACVRCNVEMQFLGDQNLALSSFFSGIMQPSMTVELYRCPNCGHLEFFDARSPVVRSEDNG